MSAPSLLACSAAALCLGLPVVAAAAHVEAQQRAAGVADAAAIAAADALAGLIVAEPCELAASVAEAQGGEIVDCEIDPARFRARVIVRITELIGGPTARAHAGPLGGFGDPESGPVGVNGWAWPSDTRGITQGLHDGYSIDLAVTPGGALYAPYDGVVVAAGSDGGGVPAPCWANPGWWRGPNYTVLIRHEYEGRILYSSHNHIAPDSPRANGIGPGVAVRAGQRVATEGMSGCTSGPHSHFTLSTTPSNAFPDVNPFAYLGVP